MLCVRTHSPSALRTDKQRYEVVDADPEETENNRKYTHTHTHTHHTHTHTPTSFLTFPRLTLLFIFSIRRRYLLPRPCVIPLPTSLPESWSKGAPDDRSTPTEATN
jgi:hypothetical protein